MSTPDQALYCTQVQGRTLNWPDADFNLGSAVVRASDYGKGGPGFYSRGPVILKSLKMVVMASLLGAQEFRVSITTDSSVSV